MAKNISRKKLKRVLSDIDNGVYNNPQVFSHHSGVYKVLNETGKVIPKGGIVRLSGFKGMPDYETSLKQSLSGNIIFGSTTSSENTFYATAKETIPINSIGIIETDNLYVAKTLINSDSHSKTDIIYGDSTVQFQTSENGSFNIVARSPKNSNYAICAVKEIEIVAFDTETVLKTVSVRIVSDSAQSEQGGYIPVIVDAAANGAGALVFTFGYLHISKTTTTATVLKAPTT